MKEKTKIAVVGYGRVGKAICDIALTRDDFELVGAFTRRSAALPSASGGVRLIPYGDVMKYARDVNCLLLAHGSKSDAGATAAALAAHFSVIDCYDDHKNARSHTDTVGKIAKECKRAALLCVGWDPGLLSLARLYFSAFIDGAAMTTLWGPGMSLGHSEALRAVDGVLDAIEITEPKPSASALARGGVALSAENAHRRVCYVHAKAGCEGGIIESVSLMDGYFKGYETEIHFVEEKTLAALNNEEHRGRVIAAKRGKAGEFSALAELSLKTSSNPTLTAYAMLASVRPLLRLAKEERYGAYTVFDVPPAYFAYDPYTYL